MPVREGIDRLCARYDEISQTWHIKQIKHQKKSKGTMPDLSSVVTMEHIA
jgi:hypothetical protein